MLEKIYICIRVTIVTYDSVRRSFIPTPNRARLVRSWCDVFEYVHQSARWIRLNVGSSDVNQSIILTGHSTSDLCFG